MDTRGPPRYRMPDSKSESPAKDNNGFDEPVDTAEKSSAASQAAPLGDMMPISPYQSDRPKEPRKPEIWPALLADLRRSDPNLQRVLRDFHSPPNNAFPRPTPAPSQRNVSNLATGNVDQSNISPLLSRPLSISSVRSISPVSKPPVRAQQPDGSSMGSHRTAAEDTPDPTLITHRGKAILADDLPEAADWV